MEENKVDDVKVEGNSIPKPALKQPKTDPPMASTEDLSSPDKTVKATIEQKPAAVSPPPSPIPDRPSSPEPPADINPSLPPNATLDIHQFRTTSPILEDPNEDASPNNSRRPSDSIKPPTEKRNSIGNNLSPQPSAASRPVTPTAESKASTPIPKIETPPDDDEEGTRPKTPSLKSPESESGKLSPLPDTTANQASQGSPSHGKSKTSGKNLTGWF